MSVDRAGNRIGQAKFISIRSNSSTRQEDWIGGADRKDFYGIRLTNRSSLTLSLKGLKANADLLLHDRQGNVLQTSNRPGTKSETINQTLEAGTYFVQIRAGARQETSYKLNLFATSVQSGISQSSPRFQGSITTNSPSSTATPLTFSPVPLSTNTPSTPSASPEPFPSSMPATTVSDVKTADAPVSTSPTPGAIAPAPTSATTLFGNPKPGSSSTSLIPDWFDRNIQDAELKAIARSRFADNRLDRTDVVDILRNAKDGSKIDKTELTDLRTLVNSASYLQIPDYVRVLADKVVNGNVANEHYKGDRLGNLVADSLDTHMEKLIDKWFLGGDRPATSYTYRSTSGALFQNGIDYRDVAQGTLGDCYFLVGLTTTAFRSPEMIKNMFIDNGDNTYTVRLYNQGVADYVTVDRYLPTNSAGQFVYAQGRGTSYSSTSNELWVALAEKAYAQLNESKWIGQDGTNSYNGIEIGHSAVALTQITARNAVYNELTTASTDSKAIQAFNSGQLITFGTKGEGQIASNLVPGHSYALVDYNSSTRTFTLFNPWGVDGGYYKSTYAPGFVKLTWSEITANFNEQVYTTA
ncbi:pre-peptidase C-terminal domain-containing protein [Oculatella sp. LEGE 06141]|uniref:C2 family cysteine protease n=1 Tax=Oculatella sp. LEGE 06141 TaxID=1828648 RepID=UPI0018824C75|nr:C2 family cysteine protease [Oculatella sp. LEGE 06141]MBE9179811.1 pre-peptidase C-terminal domain-containing protein [Oculatella sp. LEGE 06141]